MAETNIWINAGEASGDMHGAALMRAMLRRDPSLSFTGMGGSAMRKQGFATRHDMGLISIVGLPAILSALPNILKLLGKIRRELTELRPAAVVLIDCPEFNFRVARIAHSLDIPVYYYISPQVWAWRSGRVKFLRKYVRRVLCILPFEREFYRARGVDVDFVGHPLLDELPLDELDRIVPDPLRIGVLPGSRKKEVETLLPLFGETAQRLAADRPGLHFSLFRAPGMDEGRLLSGWPKDLRTEMISPEARYRAMRSCSLAMAASGTVSLELALIGTPGFIAYRLPRWQEIAAKQLIKVKYAGLPNLILDRDVFPELLGPDCTTDNMLRIIGERFGDEKRLGEARNELAVLRKLLGEPGAPNRAAEIILRDALEQAG